jgi:hypothetical protein
MGTEKQLEPIVHIVDVEMHVGWWAMHSISGDKVRWIFLEVGSTPPRNQAVR